MNTTMDTRVHIDDERAGKLERLAIARGTTPEALIAKALDLFFLTEPAPTDIPLELKADWELLQQLDVEAAASGEANAPLIVGKPSTLDLARGQVTHAIPVPPGKLRRLGEED